MISSPSDSNYTNLIQDVSFNSIRAYNNRFDLTHNFENVVYNELVYMGYNVQVFNDGKHEIDYSTSTVRHIQFRNLVTTNEL